MSTPKTYSKRELKRIEYYNTLPEDKKTQYDQRLKEQSFSKFHSHTQKERFKLKCKNKKDKTLWENLGWESKRERIINEQNNACSICGIQEWNGAPIILEIDHINGINSDNERSNLRAICPNCHSTTPTWRGRNKPKTSIRKEYISIEEFANAISNTPNIRQALLSLGIAAKGTNYTRAKKIKDAIDNNNLHNLIINERNIHHDKEITYCKVCGEKNSNKKGITCSLECKEIYKFAHIEKYRKVIDRPSIDVLIDDLHNLSYIKVGEKYGVSDNMIRKWIKYAGLNPKDIRIKNNIINAKSKIKSKIKYELTDDDVKYIRTHYVAKDKIFGCRALAKQFNVSHTIISEIINNKTRLSLNDSASIKDDSV